MNDNTLEALEELEAKLTNRLKHTLKLAPESQRELLVFELAKYIWAYYASEEQVTQMVKEIIGSDDKLSDGWPEVVENTLRKEQRERARKYGLEIEQYER